MNEKSEPEPQQRHWLCWSHKQNGLHIETEEAGLRLNRQAVQRNARQDFVTIGVFASQEEAAAEAERLTPMLRERPRPVVAGGGSSMAGAINRDADGLAHTDYCDEMPDGGLTLRVDQIRYELHPERIADGPALGQTLLDLRQKRWFTEAVQCDLTNVVTARWLAKARGWV